MDQTAYPFVSRICLIIVIGVPLSLTACTGCARPSTHHSLSYRVQSIPLDLRVKLLENTRTQRVPELWGNKVRELYMRIVLVGALGKHIVVQRGALLAFQQQATQIGALRGVLHLLATHLNPVEVPQGRGNNAIGGASKFA